MRCLNIEEGKRKKRKQRSSLLIGVRTYNFHRDELKKRMNRNIGYRTWQNRCFEKLDDHPIYTIHTPPYHNGFSPKNFCYNHPCRQMVSAAFKYFPQTTATTLFLLFCLYPSSMCLTFPVAQVSSSPAVRAVRTGRGWPWAWSRSTRSPESSTWPTASTSEHWTHSEGRNTYMVPPFDNSYVP